MSNVFKGDDWGILLKVNCVIEIICRRAIAKSKNMKLGSSKVRDMSYNYCLKNCYELNIISKTLFESVSLLKSARNQILHSGDTLHLKLDELAKDSMIGTSVIKDYKTKIIQHINVEDQNIDESSHAHHTQWILMLLSLAAEIAKNLYQEEWYVYDS